MLSSRETLAIVIHRWNNPLISVSLRNEWRAQRIGTSVSEHYLVLFWTGGFYGSFQVLVFFSSVSVHLIELLDLCPMPFSANEECYWCHRTRGSDQTPNWSVWLTSVFSPRHTVLLSCVPGSREVDDVLGLRQIGAKTYINTELNYCNAGLGDVS